MVVITESTVKTEHLPIVILYQIWFRYRYVIQSYLVLFSVFDPQTKANNHSSEI